MSTTGTAPSITGPVTASFYSELMKNYSPELPVDATHQLEALQAGTTPWVFSVGTDNTLYAVTRQEGSGTGWVQHALSAGMGAVTAFAAADAGGGTFRLGLAVQSGGTSRFYLSAATDFTTLNLATFDPATFWTEHTLADPSATVNQVRVDGAGALIATTKTGSDALYYTVDDSGVKPYTLPEDGSTVLALELGEVYGDRGVFLLYTVGPAQTLLFQSFPDPVFGKTSKYRYAPQGAVNDFALLSGAGGTNWVIAAGDAVTLFTTPDDAPQTVAAATAGLSFTSLRAAQIDSALSLWLLGASQGAQALYYATNQFYQGSTGTFTQKWTAPLPIRQQVGRFDCLRGVEVSNQLFVVSQQNTLVHLWQDATTTLWQEAEIPVHDTGQARELDTYTLHVQFSSAALRDNLAGQTVTVGADAAVYVNLNGAGYQLGPSTPGQVPLATDGSLTVMSVTDTIAAPTLTVTAPFLDAPVTVDLMHKVRERLEPVKTGADLQAAKRYDPDTNTYVPLTSGQDPDTLDAVARGVAQLNGAAAGMKTAAPAARAALRAFAAASRPAADASATWGMSFPDGGGAVFDQGPQAALHFATRARGGAAAGAALDFSAEGIWDDLGHAFGDVIRWIGEGIDDVKDFLVQVADDVVHFAIRVGEAVYTFILTTAQEIYAAAEWLFKKIALYLKELIEWLGFLFAWKDILATRDAMKTLFNNGLSSFSGAVQTIKTQFDGWVGGVLANDLNSPELAQRLNDTTASTVDQSVSQAGGRPQGSADPRVSWVATRMSYLAGADQVSGGGITPDGVLGSILASIESLGGDFAVEYDKVSSYGTQWVNGQITTAQFAVAVLDAVGALALDIVQRIVDGILDAVSGMVDTLETFLNQTIDIPFFSALYQLVSGDPLSILDVAALIMAIPVTVAYKVMFNQAPFQNGVGTDLLNAPAQFFASFSLDGASGGGVHAVSAEVLAATAAGSSGTRVAAIMIGIVRVLRTITVALVTVAALASTPAGTTLPLVIDQSLRVFGAFAALGIGKTNTLKALTIVVFLILLFINALLYNKQRNVGQPVTWSVSTPQSLADKLGQNFNLGAAIDGAFVTTIGIWNLVLTIAGWDAKSSAQRVFEIMTEVFQIPAIVGFFANTIARNSPNPASLAVAWIVVAIREAGMLGSGISEFVVAGQA